MVGGRVVALMGFATFSRFSSMPEIVLLPTPEGPHNTMSRPSRLSLAPLLDILNLLLHPIDLTLDLDDVPGDRRIVRLAGDRVRLPQHLLADEVQLPPGVLAVPTGLLKRIQVARKPLY